jgi:hypothetical protein
MMNYAVSSSTRHSEFKIFLVRGDKLIMRLNWRLFANRFAKIKQVPCVVDSLLEEHQADDY